MNAQTNFEEVRRRFIEADVEGKIQIYTTTPGLTTEQYKMLLKLFPLKHLKKLEMAIG